MTRVGAIGRLRVGILGQNPDRQDWMSLLSSRGAELHEETDVRQLVADRLDLALVFSPPAEALRIAKDLAAQPAPPVLMLVGAAANHPHTRLVKALAEGKREWEGTFDAIVDPVAILDPAGVVVRANVGLARALGRPIVEIVSRPYTEVLGRSEGADPIAASLADGSSRTEEARYASLPGVQQVTTSPLPDDGGKRHGLVLILKDVNEQHEQQERFLQASRLADVGMLAAGVAHEINTPLASIALRAESLLRSAEDSRLLEIDAFKNFPRYLKTIDQEIFRCKKIISALLDFSRVRPPEVRDTDLNALAERAADLVGHQMKLKQVELRLQLQPDLPYIRADDGQIRQAILALLMNAQDATPSGGHVEVATHREGAEAVGLTVSDDGCGIPRELLGKIFSPFFTTKPLGQGTGLGLAICQSIVEQHRGTIEVQSEGAGKGTVVTVRLPVAG